MLEEKSVLNEYDNRREIIIYRLKKPFGNAVRLRSGFQAVTMPQLNPDQVLSESLKLTEAQQGDAPGLGEDGEHNQ